jgi:hypothetical protein
MYSATMGVMGDAGAMDLDPLAGPRGPTGQVEFTLRPQPNLQGNVLITEPNQLPGMADTPEDIGQYYLLNEIDSTGHVIQEWAYVWYGFNYRQLMMGTFGPPGPVPDVQPQVELIAPGTTSYVDTDGETLEPTWQFNLAVPAGPPGPINALANFADFNSGVAPQVGDVIGFTGAYTIAGQQSWQAVNFEAIIPQPYSVGQQTVAGGPGLTSFSGSSQQGPIGYFTIPEQSFAYVPIVWGHIGGPGSTGSSGFGSFFLSFDPFQIGCQVLLGNQTSGVQVARGIGTTLGSVNIYPHYSSKSNTSQAVTPTNNYAVVPIGATGSAATLYFNLYNDGTTGQYSFNPTNAQIYISLLPINPNLPPLSSLAPVFGSTGTFAVTTTIGSGR